MKLLFSCYCFAPNAGSEQGIGWVWVTDCAKLHDVTVITCAAQRPLIEPALDRLTHPFTVVYVKGPERVSPSGAEFPGERFGQYIWQLRAIKTARRLARLGGFDLGHHLTPGTWRLPCCLAYTRLPFIFGPTSGSEVLPPGFLGHLGWRGALWECVRSWLIPIARMDPLVRKSLGAARLLLAKGPATHADLGTRYPTKTIPFYPAYNLNLTQANGPSGLVDPSSSLRIAWSGQLVARKGLELLLQALTDPRLSAVTVHVIGDGPGASRYRELAQSNGVKDNFRFLGRLPRATALTVVSECDLFVFTSLQDMYGWALAEAMALGVPSITLDWSGPQWIAGESGCYKVVPNGYRKTVQALANAVADLRDPESRTSVGLAGQRRIRELTDPAAFTAERERIYLEATR